MNIKESYNKWSVQYDTNINKTRDVEGKALRNLMQSYSIESVLEIGCGTGKNTEWFFKNCNYVTAVDFSEEMLDVAKTKIKSRYVEFVNADIKEPWNFIKDSYDLVSFSLVLEHIEDLNHVFKESFKVLNNGGYIYVGELHPFKQYNGSKARFETAAGVETLTCFTHHISDFLQAANKYDLTLINIDEHFDEDDKKGVPRILTLLFQKK